ncbi:alpha/beta fold hydrolase [Gorillibacterium massiliense]|uniref:alpha/beta fold hydrolase n=1 Tax=Gorillibacterium massiliense TaxID=1280390 RepID=UPI0005938F11|nr:alpha/beta hydrolase [Gorillibacterium massiliense]
MERVKIYRSLIKLKETELFYMDTKTDGPAILCLHGLHGRAETWDEFIQHYGGRYRVIAPDQRGHGFSGKPASHYTMEEFAEDAAGLLMSLNIDSAVVVGHSMGGKTAGYMAALYPARVKAAAILDITADGPAKPDLIPFEQIPDRIPLTQDWPLPFSTLNEAKSFIAEAAETELDYDFYMNSLIETVEGYQMMFSTRAIAAYYAHKESWYHLLPDIKCPVLLVRAKGNDAVQDDNLLGMQSMLLNSQVREISNPDHNVHLSDKMTFYSYIDEFLESF